MFAKRESHDIKCHAINELISESGEAAALGMSRDLLSDPRTKLITKLAT